MTPKPTVQSEFEQLSPTTYRVSVTVPAENFKRKLESVYTELSQSASIPGFRPGKAPRNIINRHVGGKEKVYQDTSEEVIKETFWPVVKDKELTLIGQPRIDHDPWLEGQEFQYVAMIETIPPIPEVEYDKLKAVLPEREITDEMVEEEIWRLRVRLGETTSPTDRPVREGDVAILHFQGEVPDVMVEALEGESTWKITEELMEIEVGKEKGIEGLDEHVLGMEIEEIREFELDLPDDFGDPRVRGKKMKAVARLKGIREINPAELTDELIKEKFGEQEIETIQNLEEKIKIEIGNQFTRLDDRTKTDQLEAWLSRAFDIPLPEGLVRIKFADILDRALAALQDQDADIQKLMEKDNEAGLRIRKRARYQAERMVKLDLIMREIARKESIKVANDEVANYIMMMAMRQGIKESDLRTLLQDAQFMESNREDILRKKVSHFLLDKVKTERIPEKEFQAEMMKARDDGEDHEKQFVEVAEDPLINYEEDYLAPGLREKKVDLAGMMGKLPEKIEDTVEQE